MDWLPTSYSKHIDILINATAFLKKQGLTCSVFHPREQVGEATFVSKYRKKGKKTSVLKWVYHLRDSVYSKQWYGEKDVQKNINLVLDMNKQGNVTLILTDS